ncbi:hypothetical protein CBS9595_002483 [Malassezia furfur]|nr:hypothetical protein CBS9595_002483 [Malassezia furfur]
MVVLLDSREAVLVSVSANEPTRVPLAVGESATAACFTPSGAYLFLGTTKGNVLMLDAVSGTMQGEPVPIGGSSVRQLAFDATGRHLVANLNDRTLRTFSVTETRGKPSPYALTQRSKFQDLVGRTPWSGISFSADSEYVMGGAAQDAGHHIYLWDRDAGVLVKILEGPREPLISAQWHPVQPQIASIAASGDIYLWKTKWTEIWSAYAPGFEELEENVEYEEPEDEFDLVGVHCSPQEDESELSRKKQDEEEAVVNVFSTGPASDALVLRSMQPYVPPTRRSIWAPRLGGDTQDVSMEDDDDQFTFFLAPLLEPADASERHV